MTHRCLNARVMARVMAKREIIRACVLTPVRPQNLFSTVYCGTESLRSSGPGVAIASSRSKRPFSGRPKSSEKRTTVVNTRYIFSMKIRSQARRYTHNFYFYSHNLFSLSGLCYLDPCHMYISPESHTVIGYFSHWQLFIDMCSL